ncbi:patatin-like phospholipase family protein [Trichocoleus sp. FACHB-262]|uniref:patatin-like phospholipase family protein n=1 Tax=Trichocoleus sp. FACHB-262 TaxID=2692869 RepID=UPI001685EA47|nr:patatin-like phospholipase family protein [Trichocoleus sp. FACHB-262]MBD2122285.1 patatin-like phospholipase family protein [Trichocoleus sp. FACHB-262]
MTFRILSLDGGGIRGVIAARILQVVEQQLGGPLSQHFDLIAGTSTGSLLAAGVTLGFSSERLINLYQERGKTIFPYGDWWGYLMPQRLKLIAQYGLTSFPPSLSVPKFSDAGLLKVLQTELGDRRFCQISSAQKSNGESQKLLVTTYDTIRRMPLVFKSWRHDKWYANVPLWEICACSASAPSYFPAHRLLVRADGTAKGATPQTLTLAATPWQDADDYYKMQIEILAGPGKGQRASIERYDAATQTATMAQPWPVVPDATSTYRLIGEFSTIDGGVGANNPTACAIAEALRLGHAPQDIQVLSIGTGQPEGSIPWVEARQWGILRWAWNARIIGVTMDAPSGIHAYVSQQIIADDHYLRIQPKLNYSKEGIDNASPENLANLRRDAEACLSQVQGRLAHFLKTNWLS